MAAWPTVEEVAAVLNITTDGSDVRVTDTIPGAVGTAIEYVKLRRGRWVEGTDSPNDNLRNAALRMALLLLLQPGVAADSLSKDPSFQASMYGQRQRFGVA